MLVAPGVFDLPADGLSFPVQADAGEDHGVVHGGQAVVERVLLGHLQVQAAQQLVAVALVVPDALVAVAVVAHVAAEPDHLAVAQLAQDGGFELVHRQVQVSDGLAAHHVAQEADRVGLVEGLVVRGGVDDADGAADDGQGVLFGKVHRGQLPLDVIEALLIHIFKVEAAGRLAVAGAQEAVDFAQHFGLAAVDDRLVHPVLDHLAQLAGADLEVAVEQAVHIGGVFGLVGLVIDVLGHHAVLFDDVGAHVPLAAVVDAGLQDEGDRAVVGRQGGGVQHGGQEIVAALELIPEGQVGLGKLEVFQIQVLGDPLAQHVGGGEQPAPAGMLLVGDRQGLDLQGELVAHLHLADSAVGDLAELVAGQGHGGQLPLVVHLIRLGPGFQLRRRNGHVFHKEPPIYVEIYRL